MCGENKQQKWDICVTVREVRDKFSDNKLQGEILTELEVTSLSD